MIREAETLAQRKATECTRRADYQAFTAAQRRLEKKRRRAKFESTA